MKRRYIQPDMKAIRINVDILLNTGSLTWDEDAQTGVDHNPGSQGDFCSKMFDDDEDLW